MNYKLLHIFRNTPFGRETFLQSLYFCNTIGALPVAYIPKTDKFLMYFPNDAVQVDLDASYLTHPETAQEHAEQLFVEMDIDPSFYEPKSYTASTLPDLATDFDYLCCPRSVSDISSKVGLGYIGSRVRRIIKNAGFPVLIPSQAFKPFKNICVLFGGSSNAINALSLGLKLAMASGLPLSAYTLMENKDEAGYRNIVSENGLEPAVTQIMGEWRFYKRSDLDIMLYDVPHDALIVIGAYGHGVIKDLLFGSKMERIQASLTNNLLIAGPHCKISVS